MLLAKPAWAAAPAPPSPSASTAPPPAAQVNAFRGRPTFELHVAEPGDSYKVVVQAAGVDYECARVTERAPCRLSLLPGVLRVDARGTAVLTTEVRLVAERPLTLTIVPNETVGVLGTVGWSSIVSGALLVGAGVTMWRSRDTDIEDGGKAFTALGALVAAVGVACLTATFALPSRQIDER